MSANAATLGLTEAPIVEYGDVEDDMVAYRAAGTERAMQLGNRGPIRFTDNGDLHPEIAEAYSRCGFYVFTGVLSADELAEAAGSDRLPDAVPLVCDPGDVAITSRQAIHGSFANTSERPRVTINFGFHRRRSCTSRTWAASTSSSGTTRLARPSRTTTSRTSASSASGWPESLVQRA